MNGLMLAAVVSGLWFEPIEPTPPVTLESLLAQVQDLQREVADLEARVSRLEGKRRATSAPVITLVVTPGCGLCASQEAVLKQMGVKYSTRTETAADAKYAGYPVLELDGRSPLVGLRTRAAVEAWMQGR